MIFTLITKRRVFPFSRHDSPRLGLHQPSGSRRPPANCILGTEGCITATRTLCEESRPRPRPEANTNPCNLLSGHRRVHYCNPDTL